MEFRKGESDTIIGDNGHSYPDKYAPGSGSWSMDEAWEIVDRIKPGVIPIDIRSFLAGAIAGALSRVAETGAPKKKKEKN